MSYYRNSMIHNGEEYILYGFEGNIAIWQSKGRTQASKRLFYANPGTPLESRCVGDLRKMIRQELGE